MLILIVWQIDLPEVASLLLGINWWIIPILALGQFAFMLDVWVWQLALCRVRPSAIWSYRLWKLRMVGEAYNNSTPLGTIGGEPLKALLLKTHYGIGYRRGIASLTVARTCMIIGLLPLLAVGLICILTEPKLPSDYAATATAGFAAMTTFAALLFLAQRFRCFSIAGWGLTWARRHNRARLWISQIRNIEDLLVRFYTLQKSRFALAVLLASLNWICGAVEIWIVLNVVDGPASWTDAFIIESIVQFLRAGIFFVPAGVGIQEGAFFLLGTALTGNPAIGIVVGGVRRIRELIWIMWGLAIGWRYSLAPAAG
ncbi:MAG: lysylphosphatidylglycerol synthase domain-containing protein [Alphaproteobacteria bacterium]